jgi:hypothetical protein
MNGKVSPEKDTLSRPESRLSGDDSCLKIRNLLRLASSQGPFSHSEYENTATKCRHSAHLGFPPALHSGILLPNPGTVGTGIIYVGFIICMCHPSSGENRI